jgi:serine/threonine-protein kinase RsbT
LIRNDDDIVMARSAARRMAERAGFGTSDQVAMAAAVSEVARNMIQFAGSGEIVISFVCSGGRQGLSVVARDTGPGIPDLEQAMEEGYSTTKSLGLGLPGARRMVDEFEILSSIGQGTTIRMKKWQRMVEDLAA